MRKRDIENKLKTAVEEIAPDVFDSILLSCNEQKGMTAVMTANNNATNRKTPARKKALAAISAVAAALVLAVGIFYFTSSYGGGSNAVSSIVEIDVNPSIKLEVSEDEKVISAEAMNDDAVAVMDGMELAGTDLDVAVNALIGSMLKNGYIDDIANSILISVNSDDPTVSEQLRARIAAEIDSLFKSNSLDGAILSQVVSDDAEITQLAAANNISEGKAALIKGIMAQNPLYTFEDLAGLSINELNLLSSSETTEIKNVSSVGSASNKAYISEEEAISAALERAGVNEADATGLKAKMEYEDGVMVYDVEFRAGNREYDVDINATDGTVVKYESDIDDDYYESPNQNNNTSSGTNNNTNQNNNASGNTNSGNNSSAGNNSTTSSSANNGGSQGDSSSLIPADTARSNAFSHAGVSASDVYDLDMELDMERGVQVYEIEFKSGRMEYEYVVSATSGEILHSERDYDD